MGSKRFYEHAQNLIGDMKRIGHYLNLGEVCLIGVLELLELTCKTAYAFLFKLRPGVLSKTLSHMWGILNIPMFLFNVGSLNLKNMDSLIFLGSYK